MTVLALLLISLSLIGCGSTQTIKTQIEREPIPDILLVPIQSPISPGITWGEYAAHCELAIKQCNIDKAQIREWSNASANP
ncbi:Rz1-like lysis system protein LysC [Amphritea sp. HPY]|uniref:Rz1-like lysis system protein LysC n=1 Tax=Amphritea sp. HPY TaxID=3421652 RepID=UPI003D7CE23C